MTLAVLFMKNVLGMKGMYLRYGGYHTFEGFNSGSIWAPPPFISGSAFKELCDYNIDDRYPLIAYDDDIKEGDRVFMKVNDIPSFIQSPPPVKVTVVVSNSDETFDDILMAQVAPYATTVYAINSSAKGAKQIPIGFRDYQYTPHEVMFDIMKQPGGERNILCLVNFIMATTNLTVTAKESRGERQRALDAFTGKNWVSISDYIKYDFGKSLNHSDEETQRRRVEYYQQLKKSKFIICPPGAGMDTHRIYESLFFGCVPVIKTSFLDPMYEKLGGCWVVNDWTDVTEEACNRRWASMKKGGKAINPSDWL